MSIELSKTLAAQINATYAECQGCDEHIREWVIRKCNKARDCGILLQSYRQDCAHGQWETLFSRDKTKSTFVFTSQTARNFIAYAKANPSPIICLPEAVKSLYDHMIATGAIAAPNGHGEQQRSTLTFLDRFTLTAGKMRELFHGQIEKIGGDARALPADERAALKTQLEPVVQIYQTL